MQILCVDVGTGTQDILLFDSEREIENCVQMIVPSPTQIVASKIRQATAAGRDVLLTGRTMGGGPCAWAAEEHLRRGHKVYATVDAALTFDDELTKVERMGVRIVSRDEANGLPDVAPVIMGDLDLEAIGTAVERFDVRFAPSLVAVAVFDHGNAPAGVSDRVFRFEYIAEIVAQNDFTAFAYQRAAIPPRLTRMVAAAASVPTEVPTLVMDTAPAAVLGALEDPRLRQEDHCLVVNLGNFHTLAFHLSEGQILGLFEHHTGELSLAKLERYLDQLAAGTISNAEVFADMGHGALVLRSGLARPNFLAAIGPRRGVLVGSRLQPYAAVPHGAMMLAGCFGLLRAVARKYPEHRAAIEERLGRA